MGTLPRPMIPLQQEDPLDTYSKLVGIQRLQTGQQLQGLQIQNAQLEGQAKQIELAQAQQDQKDSQNFRDAFTKANGDPQKTIQLATQAGVGPKLLTAYQTSMLDQKTKWLTYNKDQQEFAQKQADLIQGAHDTVSALPSEQRPGAYLQQMAALKSLGIDISKFPPQYPGDDQFQFMGAVVNGHKQLLDDAFKQSETNEKNAAAEKSQQETGFYKQNPTAGAPGVSAETVSLMDYLKQPQKPGEAIHTPGNYPAWKAGQEAAVTQPFKIQTAEAEGRARQLIQGMGESVYAFKPDGTHELMSKTAALQTPGVKAMVPATEKQIGDDIMLNNRLADVQQKINNYDQALGKIGSTVSGVDQSNIAALIGKGSLKIGAFGTELPMDRANALLQKENISNLSDDGVKLLAAYYNARESLVGYNRVLSGSARGGEKQMELSLDTLPNPGTTDPRYAKEGMTQFRQNLQVVGQGLPVIPGIKRPEEWSPTPGTTQNAPPSSGKSVSLAAAKKLPQNRGKTDEEIKADIQKYGHTVAP